MARIIFEPYMSLICFNFVELLLSFNANQPFQCFGGLLIEAPTLVFDFFFSAFVLDWKTVAAVINKNTRISNATDKKQMVS